MRPVNIEPKRMNLGQQRVFDERIRSHKERPEARSSPGRSFRLRCILPLFPQPAYAQKSRRYISVGNEGECAYSVTVSISRSLSGWTGRLFCTPCISESASSCSCEIETGVFITCQLTTSEQGGVVREPSYV